MQRAVLKKIEAFSSYIALNNLPTAISVDGGINIDNIRLIKDAGADIAIVGSGIFQGSIEDNIALLQKQIE